MRLDELSFPVLGFESSDDFSYFVDCSQLSICSQDDFETHRRVGMILIDAAGRSFKIMTVHRTGQVGSYLSQAFRALLHDRQYTVDQHLVERGTVSLEEAKARGFASIKAFPEYWRDDEAIAGESGPPQTEAAMLGELRRQISQTKSIRELAEMAVEIWEGRLRLEGVRTAEHL